MRSDDSTDLVDFQITLGHRPRHNVQNDAKMVIENVDFWYGDKHTLKSVNLKLYAREVTAFIGPSGCGKTTLLRCLNRTNEIIRDTRMTGRILLDGEDIYADDLDPPLVRRRFGWVAQRPNPFPWSVYTNVAYGPRIHGLVKTQEETDALVEDCLRRAALWDEVKDRLSEIGIDLSGGQQQRLCIARAIATDPDVILMDEPASSLDPIATAKIENLIDELRERYAIVIITHNMQQAARVAQRVAVFHLGRLVEEGDAETVFLYPRHEVSKAYIMGRMG